MGCLILFPVDINGKLVIRKLGETLEEWRNRIVDSVEHKEVVPFTEEEKDTYRRMVADPKYLEESKKIELENLKEAIDIELERSNYSKEEIGKDPKSFVDKFEEGEEKDLLRTLLEDALRLLK